MLFNNHKRCREDGNEAFAQSSKRIKRLNRNHYDDLSDELVLRIFSFIPFPELTKVETVCKRFRRLSTDNGVWREKFYREFVFPRVRRMPSFASLHAREKDQAALDYASRLSKQQEQSGKHKQKMDWKHRFKVKLNWSRGRCTAHELPLNCPAESRLLVKVIDGVTVTASERGLRSYFQLRRPQLSGSHTWGSTQTRPTALAVCRHADHKLAVVGFDDGNIQICRLDAEGQFKLQSSCELSPGSAVTDIAVAWPYLLVLLKSTTIKLIEFESTLRDGAKSFSMVTLANLQSVAAVSVTSLSIRQVSSTLIASIAYPFHRINAGYCLGIQEIRMDLSGQVTQSRLASTIDTPLLDFPLHKRSRLLSRNATTSTFPLHPQLMDLPNSISHSGCYVLIGLPDNTLMVYTVSSTADALEISAGRRLWGHTSSISGAQVSDRGKALSVSVKGDEIRIWELEDILSAQSLQNTSTALRPTADPLSTALAQRGDGLGLAVAEMKAELSWTRHWIGFDEEQVVVLGERDQRQVLSCFSFA